MRAESILHRPFLRTITAAIFAASVHISLSTPTTAAALPERESQAVAAYITSGGHVPQWARSPNFRAALFEEAEDHGLSMQSDANSIDGLPLEARTLSAALRLARILATGVVEASAVQRDWTIPVPQFAPEAALRTLVSFDDPMPWLRSLAPHDTAYFGLLQALGTYRKIIERGGWPTVPAGPSLEFGMSGERVATVQARLRIEGYLSGDAVLSPTFDAAMEEAVRSFQSHHDLPADGRIGRETLAAINVDPRQRFRQIAANMERWRWLPRDLPRDRVMINAAAARLFLFEDDNQLLQLRTVVGKPGQPTPALAATISSVLLNPPWDIPLAIAAKELGPLGRQDPDYFRREGIIVLDDNRLYQLPGPQNALGRIKFDMPNPLEVYLHDTPSKNLFGRAYRFFSHGCIRVENPPLLALRLLRNDGAWTAETLDNTISSGKTKRVLVNPSVPVYVVYLTAMTEASGQVAFLQDTYRHDPVLISALFSEWSASCAQRQPASAGCRHS